MQAAGDIHAAVQCTDDGIDPVLRHEAAGVGNRNDQRLGTFRHRFIQCHVRQCSIRLAARQSQLADAPLGPPIGDAVRRFSRQLVSDIAQKQ